MYYDKRNFKMKEISERIAPICDWRLSDLIPSIKYYTIENSGNIEPIDFNSYSRYSISMSFKSYRRLMKNKGFLSWDVIIINENNRTKI